MTPTTKTYKTAFILDTRDQTKTAQELLEDVKTALGTIKATVTNVIDLGRRDFVRVTDRNFSGGHYFELNVDAPGSFAKDVQEKFRLDKVVYRVMVQS